MSFIALLLWLIVIGIVLMTPGNWVGWAFCQSKNKQVRPTNSAGKARNNSK